MECWQKTMIDEVKWLGFRKKKSSKLKLDTVTTSILAFLAEQIK